jgi:hypothetical protein
MKKVKFEKLNDAKFQKLEIDKMKEVKSGLTCEVYFYGPVVVEMRDTMQSDCEATNDNCLN